MTKKLKSSADIAAVPMRTMLTQYHLEFEKRIKGEKERVQHLVHEVLKISEQPGVNDLSENITMADLLKPAKKKQSNLTSP